MGVSKAPLCNLGEKSFATWHEALDHYETLPYPRILPGHGAPGGKELFAQMREYMTAAKKEYERMTLRKVSCSECVPHVPASTEVFSFITSSSAFPPITSVLGHPHWGSQDAAE